MRKIFLPLVSSTIFFLGSRAQNENDIQSQKLMEAKSSFEIVQCTEGKTPVTFQKITLFKHPILISDKYYDAFVFKTALEGYLYWSFQMDSTYLGGWYMIKYATKKMDSVSLDWSKLKNTTNKDKKNSSYFSDFSFDDSALKNTSLFTIGQKSDLKLDANAEYIIWFAAKTKNLPPGGIPAIISINLIDDRLVENKVISVKQFFAGYFTFNE